MPRSTLEREREYQEFRARFSFAAAAQPGPPLNGYERLTVPEVSRRAREMSRQEVRKVRDYEAAHRGRKTLLRELDRLLNSLSREG